MSVTDLMKTALPMGVSQADTNFANSIISGGGTPLRAKGIQQATPATPGITSNESTQPPKGKILPKNPTEFYKELQLFHEKRG